MVTEQEIEQVARRIGEVVRAEQVILFGSYARGEAKEGSDVDLLVIAESELPRFKRSRELYKSIRPYPFSMDLIVYTPAEVRKARTSPHSFISTALQDGKLLYER